MVFFLVAEKIQWQVPPWDFQKKDELNQEKAAISKFTAFLPPQSEEVMLYF